jgi:hypothetical protein
MAGPERRSELALAFHNRPNRLVSSPLASSDLLRRLVTSIGAVVLPVRCRVARTSRSKRKVTRWHWLFVRKWPCAQRRIPRHSNGLLSCR